MKHEQYVDAAPSAQSLIDLVPGWVSRLPALVPVTAGDLGLFTDSRVDWAVSILGGVYGKSIIELGPLEGGHTYMLLNAGASHVTAIEANTLGVLKCLIVKELLHLERASFLLGNFNPWLAQDNRHA